MKTRVFLLTGVFILSLTISGIAVGQVGKSIRIERLDSGLPGWGVAIDDANPVTNALIAAAQAQNHLPQYDDDYDEFIDEWLETTIFGEARTDRVFVDNANAQAGGSCESEGSLTGRGFTKYGINGVAPPVTQFSMFEGDSDSHVTAPLPALPSANAIVRGETKSRMLYEAIPRPRRNPEWGFVFKKYTLKTTFDIELSSTNGLSGLQPGVVLSGSVLDLSDNRSSGITVTYLGNDVFRITGQLQQSTDLVEGALPLPVNEDVDFELPGGGVTFESTQWIWHNSCIETKTWAIATLHTAAAGIWSDVEGNQQWLGGSQSSDFECKITVTMEILDCDLTD